MKRIPYSLKRSFPLMLLIALILAGCGGNQPSGGNFAITITKPSDHAVFFLNQYYGIHRAVIDIRTSQPSNDLTLYVNGSMAQDYPDSNTPAGLTGIEWNVPGPGLYTLVVGARNTQNNSTGSSNAVTVCVLDYAEAASSADSGFAYGYTGACPPTLPNSSSGNAVFLDVTARPASLAENFQCSSTPPAPILSFTANLNDVDHRTLFVTVAYSGLVNANSGSFDPQILMLNQTGPNTYYGSTDSTPAGEANLANMFTGARSLDGMHAIQWIAKAWGANGELLATDGPHQIPVNPCQVLPEPTETPVPTIPMPNLDAVVQAYPDPIYYGDTCPSLSTVTFRAALPIPSGATPDQLTVQAHVRVVIGSVSTDSGTFLVSLHPTGTWDTATGGQVFLGTLDLSHRYSDTNNHFDPASLSGTNGALLWYVDASRLDPSSSLVLYLGRSANQVLNLAACPVGGSNPPLHNGGGTQSGCGQYTNQTSCNLAGCSWTGSSCTVAP